jgi:hypothetical protein
MCTTDLLGHHLLQYDQLYQQSIKDPAAFWASVASKFHWHKKVGHNPMEPTLPLDNACTTHLMSDPYGLPFPALSSAVGQ